jgi:hypothetical protein
MDIRDELKKQTESAKLHNMDAEEIVGMFSAAQQRATHATLCFQSAKIKAKKNKTMQFINHMTQHESRGQRQTVKVGGECWSKKKNDKPRKTTCHFG